MRTAFVARSPSVRRHSPAIADAKLTSHSRHLRACRSALVSPDPKNVTVPSTSTGSVPVTWSAPSAAPVGVWPLRSR